MTDLSRRSFFSKAAQAAVFVAAAPAIVRAASLDFIPIHKPKLLSYSDILAASIEETKSQVAVDITYGGEFLPSNALLTTQMITREAVGLFKNSNTFINLMEVQHTETRNPLGIGSTLKVRLPNDFQVMNRNILA